MVWWKKRRTNERTNRADGEKQYFTVSGSVGDNDRLQLWPIADLMSSDLIKLFSRIKYYGQYTKTKKNLWRGCIIILSEWGFCYMRRPVSPLRRPSQLLWRISQILLQLRCYTAPLHSQYYYKINQRLFFDKTNRAEGTADRASLFIIAVLSGQKKVPSAPLDVRGMWMVERKNSTGLWCNRPTKQPRIDEVTAGSECGL